MSTRVGGNCPNDETMIHDETPLNELPDWKNHNFRYNPIIWDIRSYDHFELFICNMLLYTQILCCMQRYPHEWNIHLSELAWLDQLQVIIFYAVMSMCNRVFPKYVDVLNGIIHLHYWDYRLFGSSITHHSALVWWCCIPYQSRCPPHQHHPRQQRWTQPRCL